MRAAELAELSQRFHRETSFIVTLKRWFLIAKHMCRRLEVHIGDGWDMPWDVVQHFFKSDGALSQISVPSDKILTLLQHLCATGHVDLTPMLGQDRICRFVGRKICALAPVTLLTKGLPLSILVSLARWREVASNVSALENTTKEDEESPSPKKPRLYKRRIADVFPQIVILNSDAMQLKVAFAIFSVPWIQVLEPMSEDVTTSRTLV